MGKTYCEMKRGWTQGQSCNGFAISPSPALSVLAPEMAPAHMPVNSARLGFSLHSSETPHLPADKSAVQKWSAFFPLPASVFWPYLNDLPLPLESQPCCGFVFPFFFFPLAWLLLQGCCFLSCAIALFRAGCPIFFAPRLCKAVVFLLPSMGCLPAAASRIRKADPN